MRFFSRNEKQSAKANVIIGLIPVVAAFAIKRAIGARKSQLRIGATPSGKGVKSILPLAKGFTGTVYIFDPKHSISNWHLDRDRSDT